MSGKMKGQAHKPLDQFLHENLRRNRKLASRNVVGFLRDRSKLRSFRGDLRELGAACPSRKNYINAFHFILKARETLDFPLYAALAVLSAQARHPSATVFVFGANMPAGEYWRLVETHVRFILLPKFDWFGPAKILSDSQRLDIVRLLALVEIGGIAMDCDTLTLQNMDALAEHPFVLGAQAAIPGTRSAFGHAILAGQPDSAFGHAWLKAYESYDMNGGDLNWEVFVNELPLHLYAREPSDAHILPHYRWFFPLWHRIRDFLFNKLRLDAYLDLTADQYVLPLWSDIIGQELGAWQPHMFTEQPCVYSSLCLEILAALPPQEAKYVRDKLGLSNKMLGTGHHSASIVD
jgi:hypothetical protein